MGSWLSATTRVFFWAAAGAAVVNARTANPSTTHDQRCVLRIVLPVRELMASLPKFSMNFWASAAVDAASTGRRASRSVAAMTPIKTRRCIDLEGIHQISAGQILRLALHTLTGKSEPPPACARRDP